MTALLICLAGGLGATCRFAADTWISRRHSGAYPLGTHAVNVLGSFLLGVLAAWASHGGTFPGEIAAICGTGFLGGFTTFSTAMTESVLLAQSGRLRAAVVSTLTMLVTAVLAAAAGWWIGR